VYRTVTRLKGKICVAQPRLSLSREFLNQIDAYRYL
jgi:hypothetical protein